MNQNLQYNSQKELLSIPEYGRHVQHLIQHAMKIEDPEERQAMAERIVKLMMQISNPGRHNPDLVDKLWKHFFMIADFKIDVMPPSGIMPEVETEERYKKHLAYPSYNNKYRHYGSYVQALIEKAVKQEDLDKRKGLLETIASYMKVAYRSWNNESMVNDDVVLSDLKAMLKGRVEIPENFEVTALYTITKPAYNKDKRNKRKGGKPNNNNKGKSNNYRNKRR